MDEQEEWYIQRLERRSKAEAERLQALSGNEEAAQAVRDAWQPLLRRPPFRVTVTVPPYDAPDLLP